MHLRGELERVLVTHAEDLEHHRGVAVEVGRPIVVLEAVDDLGDVAQQDPRSAGLGADDELLELRTAVGLAVGAQEDLSTARFDRAAG